MADSALNRSHNSGGPVPGTPPESGSVHTDRPQPSEEPARYRLSRWVFLRGLGLIYLAAFVSAWVQIHGLVGSRGIVPVAEYLADRQREGRGTFAEFPTLCWLDAGDRSLSWQCAAGVGLSCLVILGVAPVPALALLWLLYLSVTTAGNIFFTYQWDTLLEETGFLAIFFAPLSLWPRPAREAEPSRLVRWLLLWLLFRLMFGSGMSKILSIDPAWRKLVALQFHYETQPLPPWTAWFAYHMPDGLQSFSCFLTLLIELVVPWFLFGSQQARRLAFTATLALQLVILLTGNFGFFNLLTILLCVPLLDDDSFPARLRSWLGMAAGPAPGSGRWPGVLAVPLASGILLLSVPPFLAQCGVAFPWPEAVMRLVRAAAPFRSVNRYALFSIMTTARAEVIVEGSDDGTTWRAYEFRWKPGDPKRRPRFCGPHLPRLDWQMWFAALSAPPHHPWVARFLERLTEGSPQVLGLLRENPFPERPPRLVRASYYDYRFTDWPTLRATGAWWARERLGLYLPPVRARVAAEARAGAPRTRIPTSAAEKRPWAVDR